MAEEIELANVNANDSDSKASQETADKNGVTYGDSKVKIIRKVEPIVVDDLNGGSTQRKRRSFQGSELNEAVSSESDDLDESGTPSKSKIQDFEYPESVGRFWTHKNLCRLSCWASFWLSLYYLCYSLNEITHEYSQSSNQNQSRSANLTEGNCINGVDPTAMLMFSLIYLAVNLGEMIFVGLVMHFNYRVAILIQESRLNSQIFTITFVLNLWIAVEIFLLGATILFVFYVNCGEFPRLNFLVLFRILPIIAGWVRLRYVNKAANSNNTDED